MRIFILFIFVLFSTQIQSYSQQKRDTIIIVYFENNAFALSNSEMQKLDSFFAFNSNVTVTNISGYTDTVGNEKSNLQLSAKRSRCVVAWLKKYAAMRGLFTVENLGETMPVSKRDNALNRRVEIRIELPVAGKSAADGDKAIIIRKFNFDKLYFQPDIAVIESYSLGYVDYIARILKTYQKARFEIRGHVNCPLSVDENSGYMQKMNQLSSDRAKTVYEMLVDRGIPAGKMTYKGMGNTQMLFPNAATEEEKRKNMRVEIFVLRDSL